MKQIAIDHKTTKLYQGYQQWSQFDLSTPAKALVILAGYSLITSTSFKRMLPLLTRRLPPALPSPILD